MITAIRDSILRILLILAFLCSFTSLLGQDFDVDGFSYTITSDHTVEITGRGYINHYDESVFIEVPSQVTYNDIDYTVTSIGDRAFYFSEYGLDGYLRWVYITIPETVTSIGIEAF